MKLLKALVLTMLATVGYCGDRIPLKPDLEIREYKQKYAGMITFSIDITTSAIKNKYAIDCFGESILYDEFLNKTVRELLVDGIDVLKKTKVKVVYKDMKGRVKNFGKEKSR